MPNMDSEKYSLRQRQKRKLSMINSSIDSQGYASDNSTESIQNIREIPQYRATKSPNSNSSSSKSKTKAAPLSKYRRKTANARERTRMREINTAFETLRTCVPACITNEDSASTNEKLTKITTLRLAMKYIGILSEALTNPNDEDYDFLYECTQPKVIDIKSLENLEPMELEEIPEKSQKPSKSNKNSKTTVSSKTPTARKTSSTKRQTKKQKLENLQVAPLTSPIPSAYQESPASNASSAYASLSSSDSSASPISNSSYMFDNNVINNNFTYSHHLHPHHHDHHNSMSDLSNLMLESDGESLNLSERCISPLHMKQKTCSTSNDPYECSPTEMQTLENPLELSLRLMEPATNSLSLSVDPIIPPSSCISPLMNLEPFSAFDLFHSEFNEQAALDLFLT